MKARLSELVAVLLSPLTLYCQPSSTEDEVWKVVREWNRSFAGNEPEKYFEFIHKDITLMLPGVPYRVEGKAQDKEEFLWSLGIGISKVEFFQELQPKIQVMGNTAVVSYYSRGAYGDSGKMSYLKETDILVKEDQGWKIIHIHVSESQ